MLSVHSPDSVFSLRHAPSWVLLAFSAGAVNAIAFFACQRFVTHVTGTVTNMGIDASYVTLALDYAFVLVCFILGAMASSALLDGRHHRHKKVRHSVPLLAVSGILLGVGVAGVSGAFGRYGGSVESTRDFAFLSLLSFAMGMQNAAVATSTGSLVRTTHMTGPATDLGVHLTVALQTKGKTRITALRHVALRAAKIVAFASGAAGGAALAKQLCCALRASAGRPRRHGAQLPPDPVCNVARRCRRRSPLDMSSNLPPPMSPEDALTALQEGNQRFQRNVRSIETTTSQAQRNALTEGQSPRAVILSCSDSRVPAELVFDCGLGDLFVVRVAGNVSAPSLVGSVEFAAATFGTQLVVVMGHTGCGAVKATLKALQPDGEESLSDNIRDIVERISPAVKPLLMAGLPRDQLLRLATRANVLHTASHLRHGSRLLEQRIKDGSFVVVGAEYALETGNVDFFDVPDSLQARMSPAH